MSLVPYVVEQTARGERSYDIFSRLLNDRIIVLSEDVNSSSASVIVAQLLYLEGQDPEKDINSNRQSLLFSTIYPVILVMLHNSILMFLLSSNNSFFMSLLSGCRTGQPCTLRDFVIY